MVARMWQAGVGYRTWAALLGIVCFGCTYVPNQFREDGPSATAQWDSSSTADIRARYAPTEPRQRGWSGVAITPYRGAVAHLPLYFEDPFVDKGHGRTDETHPHNVYRLGWEDFVALPYGPARFAGNLLMLPVSAIVTTPWTIMESDGRISRQLLWYDHDAERTPHHVFELGPLEPVEAPQPVPISDAGTPAGSES